MLSLRRLEVKGFGPFADRAVLQFSVHSGVTVVYGDNMRGKTSLMNALRYAFLGDVQGRGERGRRILSACNRDLVAAGEYGFSVGLHLCYDGDDLHLVREVAPKGGTPRGDGDFVTTVSLRRGVTVLGPGRRTALLRRMLPRDVARFFLFDGELLDQYAELLIRESEAGRLISEAIEQILGVPVLRDARDHLATLASQAVRASAKEASKHQKTEAIGNALQIANDTKESHEKERDRKVEELRDLRTEREHIETTLRQQESYAAAVARLDRGREDLRTSLAAQASKSLELKLAMRDAWRTLLYEPVSRAKNAARATVKESLELLRTSLRADAVRTRHCNTCDRDVPDDVLFRLRTSLPSDLAASEVANHTAVDALARQTDLDGFEHKDVRGEVQLISQAASRARLDEADARGRIVDANRVLEDRDPDDIRRQTTKLTELGGKIQAAEDAVAAQQHLVEEQAAAIVRLTKLLEGSDAPALETLKRRERVVACAQVVFANAVDRYKASLRQRVQDSATQLFHRMTTEKDDYASLDINDHYGLTIVHTDGRPEHGRSAGAEQVVALALMGALQANAPLRGPIVMDTPFGRLDPQHTANVVTALPSMAEQVILLVQEGEIDRTTIRDLLGHHLRSEYQLNRVTARRTRIAEVR